MMLETKQSPVNVIWKPLPGSQSLAISCPCNHILYEGTRGPGKTDTQIMYFRKNVGKGYGRFWRGIIFDREYKNLDDLIAKSQRWYPQFFDGARFLSAKSDYKWVWPTGEELLFRQIKKLSEYWNYHGQEFPFIGWNELTKYPTPELYDMMMSCNRSSFIPDLHSPKGRPVLPEIPLVVFSTSNPFGAGHTWVKKRFIDPAPPGQVIRVTREVFNPRTQQREDITKTQVRLFGSYKENIYLSPEYVLELESIKDPEKRKAWLWGDWDIVAGGALNDVMGSWNVLPRFKVPHSWRIDRSFDWGSTHPFSVGWWAEANGEEAILPDGTIFCPPRGSIIRINEFYGAEEIGINKGLQWSARQIAEKIVEIESRMIGQGWIQTKPRPGPADNQIYDVREKDVDSIASKMESYGIAWERSDKRPGSRINGLQLVREMMVASKIGEDPGLYITDNCRAALTILPSIQRDPDNMDDVDTDSEDHLYDEVRYRTLGAGHRPVRDLNVQYPR